jgi:hypothetical protein
MASPDTASNTNAAMLALASPEAQPVRGARSSESKTMRLLTLPPPQLEGIVAH